jgi:hypothetical protein
MEPPIKAVYKREVNHMIKMLAYKNNTLLLAF